MDSQNVKADWATLRDIEILGPSTRKHKDWFNENCDDIKQQAYLSDLTSTPKKDVFNAILITVHQKLHKMQYSWLSNKADPKIQGCVDRHKSTGPSTWCSLQGSFKGNARNSTLTCSGPTST